MASRYKKFLNICQQWPMSIERAKYMDVFGAYIQQKGKEKFAYKESSQFDDPAKCDRILSSLEKLDNDFYKKQYPCQPYITTKDANVNNISKVVDDLFVTHMKKKK